MSVASRRARTNRVGILAALLVLLGTSVHAATITFEQFNDDDVLTNQIAGVQFSNALVLTAGISLDEFEFPPSSGLNVVSDLGGPLTIVFSSPITDFKGHFTYAVTLNLSASNSANATVVTASSLFTANEAISGVAGSSPNELIELTNAQGFSKVVITGDPAGGSFVVDDISFSAVPEPSGTLALALVILGGSLFWRRR